MKTDPHGHRHSRFKDRPLQFATSIMGQRGDSSAQRDLAPPKRSCSQPKFDNQVVASGVDIKLGADRRAPPRRDE